MKKIIVLIIPLMISVSSFAQTCAVYYSATVRGGYNVLANQPTADVTVTNDRDNLRCKIEFGMGTLPAVTGNQTSRFVYVNPALGFIFGGRNAYYILAGATSWRKYPSPYQSCVIDDCWRLKFDSGIEFRINDLLFWNVEASYIPSRKSDGECQYLALKTGIGFNF